MDTHIEEEGGSLRMDGDGGPTEVEDDKSQKGTIIIATQKDGRTTVQVGLNKFHFLVISLCRPIPNKEIYLLKAKILSS